jgi:DNA-binding FadR family transcriptional regulator
MNKTLFELKLQTKVPVERDKDTVVTRQAAIARFLRSAAMRHTPEEMKRIYDAFWEANEELLNVVDELEHGPIATRPPCNCECHAGITQEEPHCCPCVRGDGSRG